MTLRRSLLLTILFSLSFLVKAQDLEKNTAIKLEFSEEFKNAKTATEIQESFKDEKGNLIYIKKAPITFSLFKDKYTIEAFSSKLNLLYSQEIDFPQINGEKSKYYNAKKIGEKIIFFLTAKGNKTGENELYAAELLENGILGKSKIVAQAGKLPMLFGFMGIPLFRIQKSGDNSKILIETAVLGKPKDAPKFSYTVFDNNFQEIHKGVYTLPFKETSFSNGVAVDNDANVYVLYTVDNKKEVTQEIFRFKKDSETPQRFNVTVPDKLITALTIVAEKGKGVVCMSTYANKIEKETIFSRSTDYSVAGTIVFKIEDGANEVGKVHVNPFSKEVLNFFEIKEKSIKKGFGIRALAFSSAWITRNGNVCFDLEQRFIYDRSVKNNNNSYQSQNYEYQSGSSIFIKIAPDGKVLTETIVPKMMTAYNSTKGLYHLSAPDNEDTYLVYNAHKESVNKEIKTVSDIPTAKSPEGGYDSGTILGEINIVRAKKRPVVIVCKIDNSGKKSYSELFSYTKDDMILNTESVLSYDEKSVIIIVSFNKSFKLVKITF